MSVVNCAGIGKFANSHEMPFEDWSRIIGVNLGQDRADAQQAIEWELGKNQCAAGGH